MSKASKVIFHQRNASDELDVFEATGYFSGFTDVESDFTIRYPSTAPRSTAAPDLQHVKQASRTGMVLSLDLPKNIPQPCQPEKKNKLPSSPGGRLTSFLNNIFSQTSKKNSKLMHGDVSKRRRRSSICHCRSSGKDIDAKFLCKPFPASAHTPTKYTKERIGCLGHRFNQVVSVPTLILEGERQPGSARREVKPATYEVLDAYDDEYDTDSSSDLFELQIYDVDLNVFSSGLPVFETTHIV